MFINRIDGKITEAFTNQQHEGEEFILDDNNELQEFLNKSDFKNFLNSTDWMVLRHKDQLDLNIETSLTNEEYQKLLADRQNARERV